MAKILQFPINKIDKSEPKKSNEIPSENPESKNRQTPHDEFKKFIAQMKADTLEDANRQLAAHSNKMNTMGRADFLGLSPTQMQQLLYTKFENQIFLTIKDGDPTLFENAPIMKQARFILEKIDTVKGLKLTQTGKLPRALVQDFWAQFVKSEAMRWMPHKEDDCMDLTRCWAVLERAGFLKKGRSKIAVTKKGLEQLEKKDSAQFYRQLFSSFFNKWNWGYGDLYSDLQIIQMAGSFNLFLLKKMAGSDSFHGSKISQLFLKAFPSATREISPTWRSAEEEVMGAFQLRFLVRACIPLGILIQQDAGSISAKLSDIYKTTPLFEKVFYFNEGF